MKAASPALIAHINSLRANPDAQAFVADCFTIWLASGAVLTFTNIDLPVTLNGLVYSSSSILIDGLKYKSEVGLSVDQQQISIAAKPTDMVGGIPFLRVIRNGILDGAEIQRERAYFASWRLADLANPIGSVILFKGRIGKIDSIGRTQAQITVNSDLVLLNVQLPRNLYGPNCQHVLYDQGCALSKAAHGAAGSVGAGSSNSTINWAGSSAAYSQGSVTFLSGPNTGASANVKSAWSGGFLLSAPLLNPPQTGDAFTIYQGCDHTAAACQYKFNNLINFRGFPYVPPPNMAV